MPVDFIVKVWPMQLHRETRAGAGLFVIFLTASLLLFGGVGYGYYLRLEADVRAAAHNELNALADIKASQVSAWYRERKTQAEVIALDPMISSHVRRYLADSNHARSRHELTVWMNSLQNTHNFRSVTLLDANNTVRLISPEGHTAFVHSQGPYAKAMQTGKITLSDLHRGPADHEVHMSFYIPIIHETEPNSPPKGLLRLQIDPRRYLYPMIQTWPTPSLTAETVLVRRDGNDVVYLNDLRHRADAAMNIRVPMDSNPLLPAIMATSGSTDTMEGKDYRGVPVLATGRPIINTPWFIVAKVDMAEVLAPLKERAWSIGMIAAAMAMSTSLLASLLLRRQDTQFLRRELATRKAHQTLSDRIIHLYKQANDIILLFDPEWHILEANERATEAYGYPLEELKQKTVWDIRAPETRSDIGELARKAKTEGSMVFQTVHVRKDGSTFPVEVSVGEIELDGAMCYQSIIRDITERRAAEEALRRSEARFRHLFNIIHDAVFVHGIDPDGKPGVFIETNDVACQRYGYTREELLRMRPMDIDAPEGLPLIPSAMEALKTVGHATWEGVHRCKDGRKIPVEITAASFDFFGVPMVLSTSHDISARKKAAMALAQSMREIEDLYENAPCGYHSLDKDGNIIRINNTELAWLGYSREELIGRNFTDIITPDGMDTFRRSYPILARQSYIRDVEQTLVRKDGSTMPVLLSATLVRDAAGNFLMTRTTVYDITEQKKLQAQLLHSQKMEAIGMLAGGVAHDFRNQLTVVKGYAEMLLRKQLVSDKGLECIQEILKAADHSANLAGQLLAFSRQQVLCPEVVNLDAIIDGLSKTLARMVGEDIRLKIVSAPSVQSVKIDPTQFRQALINLAANARDAMPRGGHFTLQTSNATLDPILAAQYPTASQGPYVLVTISDSGEGMDKKTLEQIFVPFFTTKPVGQGTGLGLAMVHGFVRQSGGYITVQSEPGQGTTFRIYLPAVEETPNLAADIAWTCDLPKGTGTILVVEDEASIRTIICETLRECGYTVLDAGNSQDALNLVKQHTQPMDLLVLDVVMPDVSGPELAAMILVARPEIPEILYISGYTGKALAVRGVLANDVNLLPKPFNSQELVQTVRRILRNEP